MRGKLLKILCGILAALSISVAVSAAVPQEAEAVWVSHGDRVYYGGYYTTYFWADGQTAYCMQPPKATPRNANYSQYYWRNAPNIFYGALYFGPGGPGFEWAKSQGWWPSTNYRGGWMSYGDYYAATHVLLAQAYGQNALYGTSNSYRWWANTYILGHLAWCINNYSYMIPQQFKNNCFYCPTGSRYQDIAGSYWVNSGGISIHKEEYGTRRAMAGIRFDIYNSDQWGNIGGWVTSITTNSAGNASTLANQLPLGYYMAVEANTPAGYAQARKHIYVGSHFNYASVTIQNVKYTQVKVDKKFIGEVQDTELVLYRDYVRIASVSTRGAREFSYTWKNQPKYAADGHEYQYVVVEGGGLAGMLSSGDIAYNIASSGQTTYDGTYWKLTNTQVMNVSTKKVWNDEDNKYNTRPESVEVYLRRTVEGGDSGYDLPYTRQTLSEDNNWSVTWESMPTHNEYTNAKYRYEVVENATELNRNTYEPSSEVTSQTGKRLEIVLTNRMRTVDLQINKTWVGSNPKPGTIFFDITSNDGDVAETLDVKVEGVSQKATISVPKGDSSGHMRTYTVTEREIGGWFPAIKAVGRVYNVRNYSKEDISIPVDKVWKADSEVASVDVTLKKKVDPSSISDKYAAVYKNDTLNEYILVFGKGDIPATYRGYYDLVEGFPEIESLSPFGASEIPPWDASGGQEYSGKITKVIGDYALESDPLKPKNTSRWFAGMQLEDLELAFMDTSMCQNMSDMFKGASIKRIVFSNKFAFDGADIDNSKRASLPAATYYDLEGNQYSRSRIENGLLKGIENELSLFPSEMGNLYGIVSFAESYAGTTLSGSYATFDEYRLDIRRESTMPQVGGKAYGEEQVNYPALRSDER